MTSERTEYHRKHREDNQEAYREANLRYYYAHREEILARQREAYRQRKEARIAEGLPARPPRVRIRDKAKDSAWGKAYYQAHRDEIRERQARYYREVRKPKLLQEVLDRYK